MCSKEREKFLIEKYVDIFYKKITEWCLNYLL